MIGNPHLNGVTGDTLSHLTVRAMVTHNGFVPPLEGGADTVHMVFVGGPMGLLCGKMSPNILGCRNFRVGEYQELATHTTESSKGATVRSGGTVTRASTDRAGRQSPISPPT